MLEGGLAVWPAATAIDGRHLNVPQLQALGDLLERLADTACIIDLVVQGLNLAAGPLEGELLPDPLFHVVEGALLARLNLGDVQQRRS